MRASAASLTTCTISLEFVSLLTIPTILKRPLYSSPSPFTRTKKPNIFAAKREVGRSWKVWFGAYECTNHHVTTEYEEDNPLHFYNDVIFEIQVTSLPASLYNKIAHSLFYKDEVGPLSRGDEIVIDLTKGLALCYSLCLYYKAEKLEERQIDLMRKASSGINANSNINSLVGMLHSIPDWTPQTSRPS
jgi:hypothetical protein